MPQDRLSTRKMRDVLRYRHNTGLILESIARVLNISKDLVQEAPFGLQKREVTGVLLAMCVLFIAVGSACLE